MKLLLLVAVVGLVQICSSASVPVTTDESSEESGESIEHLRELLQMIPGIDSTNIDDIMDKFQMFHEISVETEDLETSIYFLSLAIDAEFAKVYRAVYAFRLTFIEEYILNADSTEEDITSAEEMERALKELEIEFLKELTQSQTDHAMQIIRANGELATQEVSEEDEFEFLLSMDHISQTAYENNEILARK